MPLGCPKCHAVNSDAAKYCNECGNALHDTQPRVETPAISADPPKPSPVPAPKEKQPTPRAGAPQVLRPPARSCFSTGKKLFGWLLMIGGTLLVLFGIVGPGMGIQVALVAVAIIVGLGCIVLALILISTASPKSIRRGSDLYGIVTNLREWTPQGTPQPVLGNPLPELPCDGLFDLRRTDEQWRILDDGKGFLLPVVTIEFYSRAVHGPPIEEGSRLVLRSQRSHFRRMQADEIWNTSPGEGGDMSGNLEVIEGRVTNWEFPRQASDRRYPGHNRTLEVWSFRLQRMDERGNLLPAMAVEIRAEAISGPLRDGDDVKISGYLVQGTLYAREVVNKTLRSTLIVRDWRGMP